MLAEKTITLASLYKILFKEEPLILSGPCIQKLEESFNFLKTFSNDKIIYGINTGFGPMAQYRIEDESLSQLQYNIIRSHAPGAGQPLPELYVKAAMIARLYTFLQGKSGVHKELNDAVTIPDVTIPQVPIIKGITNIGAERRIVTGKFCTFVA